MITNFEEITIELNKKELEIVKFIIGGLETKTKNNPIKAPEIVSKTNIFLKDNGYKIKLTQPRLRKIINHIRTNGLLPVIATSNGYYISTDKQEIEKQIESLMQRARSIETSANGLQIFLN